MRFTLPVERCTKCRKELPRGSVTFDCWDCIKASIFTTLTRDRDPLLTFATGVEDESTPDQEDPGYPTDIDGVFNVDIIATDLAR